MKKLLLLLVSLVLGGCGSSFEKEGQFALVLGQNEQPMYIDAWGGGYHLGSTTELLQAPVCGYHSSNPVCNHPGFNHTAAGLPYDRQTHDATTNLWYTGLTAGSAREVADSYWLNNAGYSFTPTSCSGQPCSDNDFTIVSSENISPNNLSNVDRLWSDFVRFSCLSSVQLEERVINLDGSLGPVTTAFGQHQLCKRLRASVDVGSFRAWVDQWATTSAQKQKAVDKLYVHMYGVLVGAGTDPEFDIESISSSWFHKNNNTNAFADYVSRCPQSINDSQEHQGIAAFSQVSGCD